jgi:glutaminyl-peptide cyclotransferase
MRLLSQVALLLCLLFANAVAVPFLDVWSQVDEDEIMQNVRHIAVERIVDTDAHREVEQYIADVFSRYAPDWVFERDSFTDETPIGKKTFVNLIATLDAVPGQISDKYLVLAAHYDSKIIDGIKFEAAVDSAVPCAVLIHFARNFKAMAAADLLSGYKGHNWGIKIIFFDGEEAIHEWTPVDSIYGSRHLAQDWAGDSKHLLEKIDAFILLDLLGGPNMAPIPSRYTATNKKFNYFVAAQTASQQAGRYVTSPNNFNMY